MQLMVEINIYPNLGSIFDAHRGKHSIVDTGRVELLIKGVD